jgi:hypothetical protein
VRLQWAGLLLALVTFGAIAAGHVLVRRLHARYGTRPALFLFLTGGLVLVGSLGASNDLLSGVLGITAITILWDGIEIYRQEKRMTKK